MKTLDYILEHYADFESILEDRFGKRFCDFLTIEQMDKIGFKLADNASDHVPKPFTREVILEQLKDDVLFGWEKACDERGISSSLMYEVVKKWNDILEEGLEGFDDYPMYGKPLFIATAKKYGWELP
jgi:hypothetical protein